MNEEELHARWQPLVNEELNLATGIARLTLLDNESKISALQTLRQNAGFLRAGLARLRPPTQSLRCHAQAVEGATQLQRSLATINELWMQRLPPAEDPRARANTLARELCESLRTMKSAREACGLPSGAEGEGAPISSLGCE
jgi:hypothetical protein